MHHPFTIVIRPVTGLVSRTYSLVITMLIALIIGATGCKENSPADQEPQKLKAVDLGLSVRWASMNLGAEAEEDAWMISFSENALDLTHGARYKGLTIRPVCE